MVREGDIIEIPFSNGRKVCAWVVLVSHRFKDCVGFVILCVNGTSLNRNARTQLDILGPYYTHIRNLDDLNCKLLDHVPISDRQKEILTTRIVAGGIYVGDEFRGPVENREGGKFRKMLAMGMPSIVGEIESALPILLANEPKNHTAESAGTDIVRLDTTADENVLLETIARLP